jgi:hypothetical protein
MGNSQNKSNGSALGFEATLWATADKLRGNLDAAENLQGSSAGCVDNLSSESCEFPRKLKNRPSNLRKLG